MTTHFRYEKCPVCRAVLAFHEGHELAFQHLLDCAKKQQLEAHPEVNDEDQLEIEIAEVRRLESSLDGCENLAPRNDEVD